MPSSCANTSPRGRRGPASVSSSMATILGMALGGWVSGLIYDLTGSYRWAFLNGIAFNALNVGIMLMILLRSRPRRRPEAVPA